MTDTIPPGQRVTIWRKYPLHRRRKVGYRTICEVLRELYRDADKRSDTLSMSRLDEATDMAKRMQMRLNQYAGGRTGVVSFDGGMAWVQKDKLLRLTDEELHLIEEHRKAIEAAKAWGTGWL